MIVVGRVLAENVAFAAAETIVAGAVVDDVERLGLEVVGGTPTMDHAAALSTSTSEVEAVPAADSTVELVEGMRVLVMLMAAGANRVD